MGPLEWDAAYFSDEVTGSVGASSPRPLRTAPGHHATPPLPTSGRELAADPRRPSRKPIGHRDVAAAGLSRNAMKPGACSNRA